MRNPIDNFISYINLATTGMHSMTPNYKAHEKYPEDWDMIIRIVAQNYHKYITDERKRISQYVPTLYLRFEDLLTDSEKTLSEMFCFLLNVTSIEGTVIEHRIKEMAAKGGASQASVYSLKKADNSKFFESAHAYTDD